MSAEESYDAILVEMQRRADDGRPPAREGIVLPAREWDELAAWLQGMVQIRAARRRVAADVMFVHGVEVWRFDPRITVATE